MLDSLPSMDAFQHTMKRNLAQVFEVLPSEREEFYSFVELAIGFTVGWEKLYSSAMDQVMDLGVSYEDVVEMTIHEVEGCFK